MSADPIMKEIRQNWMIIVFVVGAIASWATTNARLAEAEAKITKFETMYAQVNSLSIDMAVVKTNVEFIKANLH